MEGGPGEPARALGLSVKGWLVGVLGHWQPGGLASPAILNGREGARTGREPCMGTRDPPACASHCCHVHVGPFPCLWAPANPAPIVLCVSLSCWELGVVVPAWPLYHQSQFSCPQGIGGRAGVGGLPVVQANGPTLLSRPGWREADLADPWPLPQAWGALDIPRLLRLYRPPCGK